VRSYYSLRLLVCARLGTFGAIRDPLSYDHPTVVLTVVLPSVAATSYGCSVPGAKPS